MKWSLRLEATMSVFFYDGGKGWNPMDRGGGGGGGDAETTL
jgi:hypothetical protein